MAAKGWCYEHMSSSRLARLTERVALVDLVDGVIENARIESFTATELCGERQGKGAARASLKLVYRSEGHDDAFDRLLNGSFGLRARYAISPEAGALANAEVCQAFQSSIAKQKSQREELLSDFDITAHCRSLTGQSAKLWFDSETDKASADETRGKVTCDAWQHSDEEWKNIVNFLEETVGSQKVRFAIEKGRTAPIPTGLELKGAFIRPDESEYIPINKSHRSQQLNWMGWT